ncbi:uncharacterized protein LOC124398891 isoform X2 [Silurus meridionalis]|uniref:uncharacterized protein LOC124398891 isoform X2 n=1 Tax=Silurus meridionalis TaxID=175797 RepID=UPI001EE9FDAD|nr:uncharacterized protein LOC124398891 isoform X2 [Silurus meridionalis]
MSELEKNCSEVTDTQHKEEADGQNVPFPGPLMSEKMQKEDLSRFIQRRCQECALHLDDPDQLKSYFFWMIMERFLNQNRGYSYGRRKLGRIMIQEDWCLPLARLLSSAAAAGDQHRTDIIKMGDDFASRGRIFAAHLCYVVGRQELGFRRKFHLIGCERIPTNHIISQEVLKRTEVYEYVLSLTSGFGQPHFQKIKLIHAQNLVAVGLKALALDYCESIATTIFRSPRLFNRYILAQLIVFCEKLLEGKEDVDWMMKLRRLFRFFSTPISVVCPDQVALEKIPYQPEEFEEEVKSQYIVGEILGKGSFSSVYAAVRKADGKQVALKYVTKDLHEGMPGEKPKEVEMMDILCKPPRCKNIVELQEWFDISSCFVLVLERPIPSMDLQKFCKNYQDGHLPEYLARVILQQVIRAAQHCFDRGVFHSDLRTQNILINTDTLEVKLIDFGCVEMLCKNSTGCRSYLWSLGWTLVELVCGNIFLYNLDHVIDSCSQMISDDCCHLISQCLIHSEKPLTLDELLNHSWFTSGLEDLSHDRELEKNQLRPL